MGRRGKIESKNRAVEIRIRRKRKTRVEIRIRIRIVRLVRKC